MTEQPENQELNQEPEISLDPEENKISFGKGLRRDFFYGIIVILPTIATIGLVIFSINIISGPVSAMFGQKIPMIVSFLLTLLFITLTGLATRHFIGAAVLKLFENYMYRIPIISSIYKSMKQIVNVFSFQDKNLLGAVLVEYPKEDTWALAFITKENASGIISKTGENITENKVALFVPTTPNPTSGYLIYVDRKKVKELALSVEDSVKLLMSAGVIAPELNEVLKKVSK